MTSPGKNKGTFLDQLTSILRYIPYIYNLMLLVDFSARLGSDNDKCDRSSTYCNDGKCWCCMESPINALC